MGIVLEVDRGIDVAKDEWAKLRDCSMPGAIARGAEHVP